MIFDLWVLATFTGLAGVVLIAFVVTRKRRRRAWWRA